MIYILLLCVLYRIYTGFVKQLTNDDVKMRLRDVNKYSLLIYQIETCISLDFKLSHSHRNVILLLSVHQLKYY